MIIRYRCINNNIRLFAFSFLLFFSTINYIYSQDLYNLDNSRKYANYLMLSKQYDLAAEEYERLVFMDTTEILFKTRLIVAYRHAGKYNTALSRLFYFGKNNIYDLPQKLSIEYLTLLLFTHSIDDMEDFLTKSSHLDNKNRFVFKWASDMVSADYKKALFDLNNNQYNIEDKENSMLYLTRNAMKQKFKSPFVAGSLSTIVPGLGKIYTRNYMDGIMALLFVGGTAWQSYVGFNNKGIKSISGWIFGGISLGFYIGNIYGSVKSAKRYNKLKIDETNKKVYNFIQSYNF